MRAFVQAQSRSQKDASAAAPARPGRASRASKVNAAAQADAAGGEARSAAAAASPGFAHDFSRVPVRAPAAGTTRARPAIIINRPGDEYEQEADRVALRVTRMSEPRVQRACACGASCPDCRAGQPEEESGRLQTKPVGAGGSGRATAPPVVHDVLRSPGQPLDAATRGFMESRVGHDFGPVRVHTDGRAAESTRALRALAYTVGRHVVFGPGQYAPGTSAGRRLIAHELTHVMQQQGSAPPAAVLQRDPDPSMQHVDDTDMAMEREYADSGAPKAKDCGRPSWCPAGFCSPYTSEKLATYYRAKNGPFLLAGITVVVDSRVVPFWKEYLDGGSPPKEITAGFAKDFTDSPTTKKATTFLTGELKKSLTAKPPAVTAETYMDVAPLIPSAVAALNDPVSPNRMNFSAPRDIPGNLAGDIGTNQTMCKAGAQPSPFNDERKVAGVIEVKPNAKSGLDVTPYFAFTVKDTVDLCPGDCGSPLEQVATVPLSQFEATGISGDVPFTVIFPSPPAGTFTIPAPAAKTTTPPSTPAPAPKTPTK